MLNIIFNVVTWRGKESLLLGYLTIGSWIPSMTIGRMTNMNTKGHLEH
jgi:hypothetical protein